MDGAGGLDTTTELQPSLLLASATELPSDDASGRDSASALEPSRLVSSWPQAGAPAEERPRGRQITTSYDTARSRRLCCVRREEPLSYAIRTLYARQLSDWPPRAASRRLSISCPPCPDRDNLEPATASSAADSCTPPSRTDSPEVFRNYRSCDADGRDDVEMAAVFGLTLAQNINKGLTHELTPLSDNSRSVAVERPSPHYRSSSLPPKTVKGVLVKRPSHPPSEVATPRQKKAARFVDDPDDGRLDLKRTSTAPSAVRPGTKSQAGYRNNRSPLDGDDLVSELAVDVESNDSDISLAPDTRDVEDEDNHDVSGGSEHEVWNKDDQDTANDDCYDTLGKNEDDLDNNTEQYDQESRNNTQRGEQNSPDENVEEFYAEDHPRRSSSLLVEPLEDEREASPNPQDTSPSDKGYNSNASEFAAELSISGPLRTHGTSMLTSQLKDGIRRTVSMSEVTWLQGRLKVPAIRKTAPAEPAVTACNVRTADSPRLNTAYGHSEARSRQVRIGKETATTAQTMPSGLNTYQMLWEEAQPSSSSSDMTILHDSGSAAIVLSDLSLRQLVSPMENIKTKLAAWSWTREQASMSGGEQPRWLPLFPVEEAALPKSRGSETSPSIELPAAPPNTEKYSDLSSPRLSSAQTPDHYSDDEGSPIELRFESGLSRPRVSTSDIVDYLTVPTQSQSTPATPGTIYSVEHLTRQLSNLEDQAPFGHHRDSLTLIYHRLNHERLNQALIHTRDSIVINRDRRGSMFRGVNGSSMPPKSSAADTAALSPILDASAPNAAFPESWGSISSESLDEAGGDGSADGDEDAS